MVRISDILSPPKVEEKYPEIIFPELVYSRIQNKVR
jgi:hypothetical protein